MLYFKDIAYLFIQMQKHKTFDKLPLQANVYPMPAQAFIEDTTTRISVLTAQSLGVACHNKGLLFTRPELLVSCLYFSVS